MQRAAAAVEHVAFETLSATTTVQDAVPVMMAAPEAPIEQPTVPRLLTNLVSVFGLGALASDTPGAPIGTPIVMALLALGVRRESEESVSTLSKTAAVGNSPVAALALTGAPTAAVAAPSGPVDVLCRHSGRRQPATRRSSRKSPARAASTTRRARFGIGGTDLGIMWDNGIRATIRRRRP